MSSQENTKKLCLASGKIQEKINKLECESKLFHYVGPEKTTPTLN